MGTKNSIIWRIVALITAIGNILFSYFWQGREELAGLTDKYDIAFVPAGYAFAIWGLIYLASVIYIVYSLLPSQRAVAVHDTPIKFLIVLSVLGPAWLLAYTSLLLPVSVAIIVFMLIIAILSLITAKAVRIPFALYAGWLSVASISNISLWLKSMNWSGGGIGEDGWAIIMLIVAGILGILVTLRYRTIVYALVIAWACVGIYVEQRNELTNVGYTALAIAIIQILFAISWQIKHGRKNAVHWQ